ncbi:MAG: hypothetical protein Q7T00_01720 [Rugosibacter sp.]|nr:hypothetical protein [Rugosibacter sp.]MDO9271607.1 hypothetical protein [Rugosibacter sp.]
MTDSHDAHNTLLELFDLVSEAKKQTHPMPIRILSWCGKGGFDQGQQGMTFLGNDEIFRNVCCVDIDQPETWCRLIG